MMHHVRFLRCVDEPGTYRAVCSCGWAITGDQDHVHLRAATHDLDDFPRAEPPLRRAGFVSGLPDLD